MNPFLYRGCSPRTTVTASATAPRQGHGPVGVTQLPAGPYHAASVAQVFAPCPPASRPLRTSPLSQGRVPRVSASESPQPLLWAWGSEAVGGEPLNPGPTAPPSPVCALPQSLFQKAPCYPSPSPPAPSEQLLSSYCPSAPYPVHLWGSAGGSGPGPAPKDRGESSSPAPCRLECIPDRVR